MNNPNRTQNEKPTKMFTYLWYPRVLGLACMVLFGLGTAAQFKQIWNDKFDLPSTLFWAGFTLLGLALFLWADRRWTVREDGIVARSWYRRERVIYWEDMYAIAGIGLGDGIKIKHRSGKTLLTLDPWIGNYPDFVETLRLQKAELFDRDSRELSGRNLAGLRRSPLLVTFGLILSIGFILPGIVLMLTGGWPMAIFILIGGYTLYGLFSIPTAVHLDADSLRLEYLRGSRIIPAAQIRRAYPTTNHSLRGNASARAVIELTNGKKLELSGYQDGTPMVVNVLRNWLDKLPATRAAPK
jgi:hypothetical protein